MLNARSIITDKSIIAILSLAVMVPMVTGKIDLTIGYGIVLWHILVISLQDWLRHSLAARGPRCALSRGTGRACSTALLVELAQIDSFIATLGTGTVLYAIAMWHTQGTRSWARFPTGSTPSAMHVSWVCRSPAIYVLGLSLVLWIVLEYLPIGRYLYAIGANPRAAALNGISVRRICARLRRLGGDDRASRA